MVAPDTPSAHLVLLAMRRPLAKEEKRVEAKRWLFYVAVTRARRELNLVLNDPMFEEAAVPSQHLAEMGLKVDEKKGVKP